MRNDDLISRKALLEKFAHPPELIYTNVVMDEIRSAPTVGGWISVKDRLPEDERFVLVCNDDGKMMVAQYIDETAQWQYLYMAYDVDVWDDTEQGPVECWMPLPNPPKEEDDDE